jgi:enamine deaminase RidA (YjgF/YER057c/UK114 family)
MDIQRIRTNRRMSQAVVHGQTVYVAGQVADDTTTDVRDQARQIFRKIDALLAEAGSDRSKVLSANIWLATMSDFGEFNTEWEAWIPESATPARATVQAALVTPAHRIEIAIIAGK